MGNTNSGSSLRIWELDSGSRIGLIEICFPKSWVRDLALKHEFQECACCLKNNAALLRLAVNACSAENPFSREVDRALARNYAHHIFEVRHTTTKSLRQRVGCPAYMEENLPGVLCGLLFSSEQDKRELGNRLAYSCLCQGLAAVSASGDEPHTGNQEDLQFPSFVNPSRN